MTNNKELFSMANPQDGPKWKLVLQMSNVRHFTDDTSFSLLHNITWWWFHKKISADVLVENWKPVFHQNSPKIYFLLKKVDHDSTSANPSISSWYSDILTPWYTPYYNLWHPNVHRMVHTHLKYWRITEKNGLTHFGLFLELRVNSLEYVTGKINQENKGINS